MSQNGSSTNDLVFGIVLGIIVTIGITLIIDKNSEKNLRILQAQQQAENSKAQPSKVFDYETDKLNRDILAALEKLNKSGKDASDLQLYKLEQLVLSQSSKIEELKTQRNQCLSSEKTKQSENEELAKKVDRNESNNQSQNQRLELLQKQLAEAQKTNEYLLITQKQILESLKNKAPEVQVESNRVAETPLNPLVKETLPKAQEIKTTYDVMKKDPTKPKLVRVLPAPEKQPAYKPNDHLE